MIKNVEVIKGCISCRNCETVCPSIFKVNPKSEVISNTYEGNELEILQAELMCPVQVIKVKKEGKISINFKTAKLTKKNFLTPDTLELSFSTSHFVFKPGQYVSLQLSDWRGKFSRSYSIATGDTNSFTLTVKVLDKGRGGTFLKKIKVGKKITFLGALGNFYLKDTQTSKVFIATGTGLAPIISMLENTPKNIKKVVIFGARYAKDIYYQDKLEQFPNTKVIISVSRSDNTDFLNIPRDKSIIEKGRVTGFLNEVGIEDEVYICGNPNMVDNVKETLISNGHIPKNIFYEAFTSTTRESSLFKDIIFNGNIPGIHLLTLGIGGLGIFGIPLLWYVLTSNGLMGYQIGATNVSSLLWSLSWWSVVFVMAIRPLSDLFPKLGFLRKLSTLRKAFGILSASIVVTALVSKYIANPNLISSYFTLNNFSLYYPLFGRLSEITGVILLITSNNFSQQKLGAWWKRIQRISYIYFITGGIIAAKWDPGFIYQTIGIVILLWILAQMRIKIWQ